MFKRIRTVWGINTSLARLGVNTQRLDPVWRQGCQEIALQQGFRPKAVAVYMFFQIPAEHRPAEGLVQIEQWVRRGELTREEVDQAALSGVDFK